MPGVRRQTSRAAGWPILTAVLVGLLIGPVGCQPGGDGSPRPTAPHAGTSGGPAAGASDGGAASTTVADRLTVAIDRLAAGYAFDTRISVGQKQATRAQGRSIGGASDFTVESNGASITYRTVPPTSWVKQAGKAWVAVDNGVPDGDPLEALRKPTSVLVVADGSDAIRIQATYPASALGLAGDGPVKVDLSIAADGSVRATYAIPTDAGSATAETTLRPQPDQDPIVAPSPIATV